MELWQILVPGQSEFADDNDEMTTHTPELPLDAV